MAIVAPKEENKDVIDLYGNPFYAALATVVESLRHAPYWHVDEKAPTRLDRARELVRNSRVLLQDERLASVYGSTKAYDITGFHCTCAQSQKGQSSWCVHSVAVKLARTLAAQATPAPVALGTLRAGTLPLPPVTVEERLAATTMPQEDRMPDNEYLPEPDEQDTPVTVLDAADADFPPMGQPASPATIKIPREFTVSIKGKMHVLYTGLVVAARANGLVTLSADWTYNDAELSLAHAVCTFADGRRYEESGDATPGNVSKGISMHFRRVALTRAKARCLRDALGISECSVEEMSDDAGKAPVPDMMQQPSEADLRRRIWTRVKELAPEATTREAVTRIIMERTGLALHPDHYAEILGQLTGLETPHREEGPC